MLFNSLQFLVFVPVVTALYFALPHRLRWLLLLLASCLFYMAFIPVYLLILAFTIVVDYGAGIWIEGSQGGRRRLFLVASLVANVGVLAVFKYANFATDNLTALGRLTGAWGALPLLSIALPIGLSFHTFQAMSYTIEVYRGRQPAERHFGIYALYVMFYPQLVAGPIERPQNLLPQFHAEHRFDHDRVMRGLLQMAWGFVEKTVIADRLAILVNHVYDAPGRHGSLELIVATYAFTFQIFCDFAGYSDIALGAARVMGFELMTNFDRPYFAGSVAEFWSRWHISLSTWFRDYLYIPLGGNRVPRWRWQVNLLVVFLVSGLWHGANWTYVVWGALHGGYLVCGIWTTGLRRAMARAVGLDRLPRALGLLRVLFTFHLVAFAWIFFRARSLADGVHVATHVFGPVRRADLAGLLTLGLSRFDLILAAASVLMLLGVHGVQRWVSITDLARAAPAPARWTLYYAAIAGILVLGKFEAQQFIYFQF